MDSSVVRALVCVAWFSSMSQLACAEPVVVARDTDLYSEPRTDSSVVARLREGARGDTAVTKGPWTALKTPSGSGWVLSFNLRFGSGAASAGAGGSGLVSRLTGSERPKVTATIGIRGFDTEDLRKAQFDEKQVQMLERYALGKEQVRAAATAAGLKPAPIDYLR